jgi:hypothetical protein
MKYPERYIDHEAGRQALALVAPLLERGATDPAIGQSGVLYAVVMNPARRHGTYSFEDAILVEQSFGKARSAWDADYADFARRKAKASWLTGEESGSDRAAEFWRKESGTGPLGGGVALEGIVVGVSGADPVYDEALAGAIAMSLRAALRMRERSGRP